MRKLKPDCRRNDDAGNCRRPPPTPTENLNDHYAKKSLRAIRPVQVREVSEMPQMNANNGSCAGAKRLQRKRSCRAINSITHGIGRACFLRADVDVTSARKQDT